MKAIENLRTILIAVLLFLPLTPTHGNESQEASLERLDTELQAETDVSARLDLLLRRGRLAREMGRYSEAEADAEEARQLADQLESPGTGGRAVHLLGTILAEQGELGEAIRAFFEAREQLSQSDDRLSHAQAVMAIAVAYLMAEDYEDALVYLEETQSLVERYELEPLRSSLLNNLAIAVQNIDGMQASLPIYQQALDLAREGGSESDVANQLAVICRPLLETGRLEEAEDACLEARERLDDAGAPARLRAGVRLNQAHVARARGEQERARSLVEEALALAEGQAPTAERDGWRLLYELHEEREAYRDALAAYRRAEAIERSMLDDERQREAERLGMQRELERSAREIDLLRLERELASMNMQRQRWMLWGTSSALILISLLAFLIWRVYRARARRGEELASRDPLTGLLNRRGFDLLMKMEQARSPQHGYTKAVAMADIDHFKAINDEHGHAVGDEVVKAIADRLQNNVRGFDSVVRWGGEEFLVLLPRVGENECREVANRLLQAVTRDPVETAAGPISIRMTIGIARADSNIEEAITRADRALYQGKDAGRNRVVLAE